MEQYAEYAENPAVQRSMAQIAGYRANARLFDQFIRHEGRLRREIELIETRLADLIHTREEAQQRARALQAQKAKLTQLPAVNQAMPAPIATKQSQPQPETEPNGLLGGSPSRPINMGR